MESPNQMEALFEYSDSLPKGFDFYSEGKVQLLSKESSSPTLEELIVDCLGFQFEVSRDGRPVLTVITIIDEGLDRGAYMEIGNIIACRLASDHQLMVSPAKVLQEDDLQKILTDGRPFAVRSYQHLHRNFSIPFRTVILPYPKDHTK